MVRSTLLACVGAALAVAVAQPLAAQSPLCSQFPFASNNGGTAGGVLFYDLVVNQTVIISSFDCNLTAAAGTAVSLEIYTTPTTHVGNEQNAAAWTLVATDVGGATAAGRELSTSFTLTAPWTLTPGNYGIGYRVIGGGQAYNGLTGTPPAQLSFSTAEMTINTGAAISGLFTGTFFPIRSWNGCINYMPGVGLFPNFTADATQVGPNQTVTFTDTSFTSDPGGILVADWDFTGDGLPDQTGSSVTWTYTTCGPQDVTLTVTDATGSASLTKTAFIDVGAPTASFDVQVLVSSPLVLQFNDTSGGLPTSYDWDLDGDGVFGDSTSANPSGAYPNIGLTTVRMRATNACGTDEATYVVDTRAILCTTFAGGNGLGATGAGSGNFFDLDVINAPGITINGLSGNYDGLNANVTVTVYTTPGTYVGSQQIAANWTQVAQGTGIAKGAGNETVVDIDPFHLPQGTYGVFVHVVASAGGLDYTNGTGGNQVYSNPEMTISTGQGVSGLFTGAPINNRVWNGCLSFRPGMNPASTTGLGGGCANSTGNVALHNAVGLEMPLVGNSITYEVTRAPANQAIAGLFVGFANLGGIDLGIIGAPGCALFPASIATVPLVTDAAGRATASLNMGSFPAGVSFYTQAAVADIGFNPLGIVLSNALESTVGN